ncbi:hypothetical protein D9613_009482 [Agrocybe pediades]|uniref:Uncharacterized protein n=1 Tax=Agrocybe pediades TaxID=84607 RepID=A0A8H4VWC4_9AGAR|nr:hypothetical protein D9613_009482 [Agrocybe pediades]KAF9559389.1 hypothetical protein CPC08DRAFT_691140 [Agrocybe pediades]
MLATLLKRAPGRNFCLIKTSFCAPQRRQARTSAAIQFKATLDGGTLYVEEDVARALGWTEETSPDGVSLRLSGWGPHYFAITQKGTDADLLARSTVESSRDPLVQATLEYLKKTDSE